MKDPNNHRGTFPNGKFPFYLHVGLTLLLGNEGTKMAPRWAQLQSTGMDLSEDAHDLLALSGGFHTRGSASGSVRRRDCSVAAHYSPCAIRHR